MDLSSNEISLVYEKELSYPKFPYCPNQKYPELAKLKNNRLDDDNLLYEKFREALFFLGLDSKNFGANNWNPFKAFIKPGQTVLIKPNWVMHFNPIDKDVSSLITHSSFIKMAIDYTIIALSFRGKIIIADAPLQACDFKRLLDVTKMNRLVRLYKKKYPKITFQILDLRKTILLGHGGLDEILGKRKRLSKNGDPKGYSLINLNRQSLLTDLEHKANRFRVTMYDSSIMQQHHRKDKHEYLIANSVLSADAIINIPKIKCHIKSGFTGALKNMVGINGHKEYLPHHIVGSFIEGGDQYIYKNFFKSIYNKIYDDYWAKQNKRARVINLAKDILLKFLMLLAIVFGKDNLFEGSWFGNETIPRTIIDLNNILYFFDFKRKRLANKQVRDVINIVDGIVAGEGKGPLRPKAKKVGVLLMGTNPLSVDLAMAQLIGYDPLALKTLFYALHHQKSRLGRNLDNIDDVKIIFNKKRRRFSDLPNLNFIKPKYWLNVSRR